MAALTGLPQPARLAATGRPPHGGAGRPTKGDFVTHYQRLRNVEATFSSTVSRPQGPAAQAGPGTRVRLTSTSASALEGARPRRVQRRNANERPIALLPRIGRGVEHRQLDGVVSDRLG